VGQSGVLTRGFKGGFDDEFLVLLWIVKVKLLH